MIIASLCTKVAQIELRLLDLSEGSHCHRTCRSLLAVKASIVAFNVGITTSAIRRVDTGPCHANRLLGEEVRGGSAELPVVLHLLQRHGYPFILSLNNFYLNFLIVGVLGFCLF